MYRATDKIERKERRRGGSYQAYKRFHLASFQSASEASVHPHDPHNRVTADGTNDPTAFAKLDVQIWNSNRFRLAAKSIYRAVSLWQRRNLSSMRDSRPTSRCTHSWKRNGIDVNVFVTRRVIDDVCRNPPFEWNLRNETYFSPKFQTRSLLSDVGCNYFHYSGTETWIIGQSRVHS